MNGERGDDFLDLEGTMILVVQFLRGAACFDVSAAEHYQVSYSVCGGFLTPSVGIPPHSFLGCIETFSGFLVYHHPVPVHCTSWVERFLVVRRVQGCWVESIIRIEGCYSVAHRDRVIVAEFCHG